MRDAQTYPPRRFEGRVLTRTARVLLVDDDEWVVFSAQPILESLGYEVDLARSGPEALERFRPADHAFVLLDYRLPGMNGVELLREMLKREPGAKLILCTGLPRDMFDVDALGEGAAFAFLQKPWSIRELVQAVAAIGAAANRD